MCLKRNGTGTAEVGRGREEREDQPDRTLSRGVIGAVAYHDRMWKGVLRPRFEDAVEMASHDGREGLVSRTLRAEALLSVSG